MIPLAGFAGVLQLVNVLIPEVANIIMLIRNSDGTTTAIISSAQAANQSDIAQIQQWLAAHQGLPAQPPKTTP